MSETPTLPDGINTDVHGHDYTHTETYTHGATPRWRLTCQQCGDVQMVGNGEDPDLAWRAPDECQRIIISEPGTRQRKGLALRRTNQSWWYLESFAPAEGIPAWDVKAKMAVYPEDLRRLANTIEAARQGRPVADGGGR